LFAELGQSWAAGEPLPEVVAAKASSLDGSMRSPDANYDSGSTTCDSSVGDERGPLSAGRLQRARILEARLDASLHFEVC
jgi:hypothetical protein